MRRSAAHTVLVLVLCSAAWAAESPVAVSPGSATGALIGDTCPTFSWGTVPGAESYELVVYRVEEGSEEAEPVLRETFAGSVSGWTPSLDRCLERGGRYAWSVRAVGEKASSEWSPPNLFEVASGASEAEFEEAVGVVRSYLEEGESSAGEEASASRDSAEALSAPGPSVASRASEEPTTASASGPSPQSHQGSGSAIIVDGAEVETKADPPCYPSGGADGFNRYINCGNLTSLDTVNGLLWLQYGNCPEAQLNWWEANAFAAGLASGQCGLTDHSQPGDWRLPTREEWATAIAQAVVLECTIAGVGNPPSLTNDQGTACLNLGPTSFFAVQSSFYWSSSSHVPFPTSAWGVSMKFGSDGFLSKAANNFVWPVRSGQ